MSQVQNIPYAELEVGQKAEYTSSIAERDLQLFAAVSGDRNPVHLDAAYAATTQFKERIAHGMLSGALISAAIATVLPGPGTIYLGQTLRFTRPVKLGDDLKVELEVLEKLPKNRVRMATRVFNQAGKQVVDGEAEIMSPPAAPPPWKSAAATAARFCWKSTRATCIWPGTYSTRRRTASG